jgi:hypothetical protein
MRKDNISSRQLKKKIQTLLLAENFKKDSLKFVGCRPERQSGRYFPIYTAWTSLSNGAR